MQAKFIAGTNSPGYLPDSDPVEFEDFEDAKQYILDELKVTEDHLTETMMQPMLVCDRDEMTSAIISVGYVKANVKAQVSPFSITVRGRAYWVARAPQV